MKHFYLFVLFVLTSMLSQAQIVNIPDAIFKAKLLNHNPVIDTNGDGDIQVSEAEAFTGTLYASSDSAEDKITNMIGIEAFVNIIRLRCDSNELTSLDLSNNRELRTLFCTSNQLTSLDLSNNTELTSLHCGKNLLQAMDLTKNTKLITLYVYENQLTSLDLLNNTQLRALSCGRNMLTFLDISNNTILESTSLNNNYFLKTVNLKNRIPLDNIRVDITNCPNLETICVDDIDYAIANYSVDPHAIFVEDCSVNSINYNTIQGVLTSDENNNGCDSTDPIVPNILVKATDGTNEFATLTDASGAYSIPVVANIYETFPQGLLYHGNISISPTSYMSTFTGFSNTETADFCVTFNENSYDLNIKLIPIVPARPGFDATYQLVYENLGASVDNGSVTLTFDDTMQSFVEASPTEDASTPNTITFNYTNLRPFEKRVINITMNTFTPPTVNGDDILNFEASITPNASDTTPEDNTYNLSQIVVNSFDPNDKQVLQGTEIHINETGEYLDYIIRFQNTGTASAINVAITDILNSNLDWDSIKMISSSHLYTTRITNGNFVEFIFNDINLPAEQDDEPASHGFVAFKIKPKSNVVLGDIINGRANIYFDYNAPIETNWVFTKIVDDALSVNKNELEASLVIYPNPATTELNIKVSKGTIINKVALYSITGKELFNTVNASGIYDLTHYKSGIYFVKIETNKGVFHKKIVKK